MGDFGLQIPRSPSPSSFFLVNERKHDLTRVFSTGAYTGFSPAKSSVDSVMKPKQRIVKQIDEKTYEIAAKVDEYIREFMATLVTTIFEELSLYYVGPVDGHNLEDLVDIFEQVKAMPAPGPVLVHIITEKGKGYPLAEVAADKMHGVVKFDPKSGKQMKQKTPTKSYTQYFGESLIAEAQVDDQIVKIHAAMGGGTGLNLFQKQLPNWA